MKLSRRTLSWAAAVAVAILVVVALLLQPGGVSGLAGSTASPSTVRTADPSATGDATRTQQPTRTQQSTGKPAATRQQNAGETDPESGLPWIEPSELPAEARETITLIDRGGPFPYDKDGATFGNFEQILPDQRRGFYKEYTVETPGSRDRGARRIVTGDSDRIFYWTDDHYSTFSRIRR